MSYLQSGDEAKADILKSHPGKKVHVVPAGSMVRKLCYQMSTNISFQNDSQVTMDFDTERIRIFVNPEGKVSQIPRLG